MCSQSEPAISNQRCIQKTPWDVLDLYFHLSGGIRYAFQLLFHVSTCRPLSLSFSVHYADAGSFFYASFSGRNFVQPHLVTLPSVCGTSYRQECASSIDMPVYRNGRLLLHVGPGSYSVVVTALGQAPLDKSPRLCVGRTWQQTGATHLHTAGAMYWFLRCFDWPQS